ncbi:amidohydrolase family protein [Luminiphilus sp.]|nr:amidohydrolase family protein [Luminiphilus sp.]
MFEKIRRKKPKETLSRRFSAVGVALSLILSFDVFSATVEPGEEGPSRFKAMGIVIPSPAPDRMDTEGDGPFDRLVVENVMLVNGLGAPPRGPVSIVISGDTIAQIVSYPPKPVPGEHRVDARGMTALPGFIDAHVHIANPYEGVVGPITPPEYVFKLWLAHGITTVRDTGSVMGLDWTVSHAVRAARNEIVAPDIVPFAMFPGTSLAQFEISDEQGARDWVRAVKARGAKGVKLRGGTEEALAAVYDEAQALGMGTASHHDQNGVYHMNVLDSARLGLDSMEHWYGLPEAMFKDRTIQDYPADYNYSDEQWRFGEAGKLWSQSAQRGTKAWQSTIDELLARDFTLVPTFTIYEANRDVMRERNAEWHEDYTLPALMRFFEPDPRLHGSYHFDWTTGMEVAWRDNFKRWMSFVNDFKNAGGRVATGSDSGFIYKVFGFGYIRELEMLQEAGFHPLEVVQAATRNGAELLGMEGDIGSISPGKRADIVLVEGNPISNFKLLYGTGHMKLNREKGIVERVGGVSYTIKDGVVYDAKVLLSDVREMVSEARSGLVP